MRRALALARRGEGLTRPNPPVGAVVVRGGREVGAGWHRRAGGPHAEVYALRQAGPRARGATLYVTLEPCSSWGRTPPCVDAILAAGVRRVVVGVRDPNPRHAGRGLRLLSRAGVRVDTGCCVAEAQAILAPFAAWVTRGRPWLTLKLGCSIDGRIADAAGRSRWITGPAARSVVQAMRRRCDAVLVGGETARQDDPSLLPRPDGGRQPWRIVVDSRGRLPLDLKLLRDAAASRTIIATTRRCPAARRASYAAAGATVWVLPEAGGGVSLRALARRSGRHGILHILCEGGGRLAESLIRAGLPDEYVFFIAPLVIGGSPGRCSVAGIGWPLARAPRVRFVENRRVGPDLLIRAVPADR